MSNLHMEPKQNRRQSKVCLNHLHHFQLQKSQVLILARTCGNSIKKWSLNLKELKIESVSSNQAKPRRLTAVEAIFRKSKRYPTSQSKLKSTTLQTSSETSTTSAMRSCQLSKAKSLPHASSKSLWPNQLLQMTMTTKRVAVTSKREHWWASSSTTMNQVLALNPSPTSSLRALFRLKTCTRLSWHQAIRQRIYPCSNVLKKANRTLFKKHRTLATMKTQMSHKLWKNLKCFHHTARSKFDHTWLSLN